MNLEEYINQKNPIYRPYSFVELFPQDYKVISDCKELKEIFIPTIAEAFPECTGIYYKVPKIAALLTPSNSRSCFFLSHRNPKTDNNLQTI